MLFPLTRGNTRHVVMTTDAVGGIWTYALDLGGALVRRGYAVTLAVLGPPAGSEQVRRAEARGLVVAHTGYAPDWLASDADEVAAAGEALASMARLLGASLLHLNHPALAAAKPFDRPVVAWCHSCVATWWETVRGTPLPEDFCWRTELVGRGLKAADAVAAPTAAFAAQTLSVYGLAESPRVVHNGRIAPDRLFTAPSERRVFTAGRLWDEGKNVAALERIAPELPVPVEAAGQLVGPNGASIVLRAIRSLGPLDEVSLRAEFAKRPIYAAPAFYEPFGLAVLEAAQSGCALVLGDIPSLRELWDGAAFFVKPGDDRALGRGIESLLRDPHRQAELGASAAARAARYSIDAMADGTVAVYAAAGEAHGSRGRDSAAA